MHTLICPIILDLKFGLGKIYGVHTATCALHKQGFQLFSCLLRPETFQNCIGEMKSNGALRKNVKNILKIKIQKLRLSVHRCNNMHHSLLKHC